MACRGSINDDTAVIPMGGGGVLLAVVFYYSIPWVGGHVKNVAGLGCFIMLQ